MGEYNILHAVTNEKERKLLMDFMELEPNKILLYASAIISSYIGTFSSEESKDALLETVINSITKESKRKNIKVPCSFCENEFYTKEGSGVTTCPECNFPDLVGKVRR